MPQDQCLTSQAALPCHNTNAQQVPGLSSRYLPESRLSELIRGFGFLLGTQPVQNHRHLKSPVDVVRNRDVDRVGNLPKSNVQKIKNSDI
jgi:hypothetical protein